MDLDIEKIHSVLLDANLPSSINDLKNPTEEFVVNLINTFLTRFYIDVSLIDKPTMEQQDIMMHFEDSDIIGLINLHVAMVQICNKIFLKDLCITDITNPGSKRVRKQAKFLANFILYATNKETDVQDRIDEIYSRAKNLQDMLTKKNDIQEAINNKAMHNAKQLSLKEKYITDIQNLQLKIEKNNKRLLELANEMTTAEEQKQNAVELCGSYKTEAVKLSKAIAESQLEIVKSPEEYQKRLQELEEQDKLKVKEREILQEAFQEKKQLIEQQESILSFIQKQLDKFPEVQEAYDQLKKLGIRRDNAKKQIETLETSVDELETKLRTQQEQYKENEVNERHAHCEESLSPLRNLHAQLLSTEKHAKLKLEEEQMRHNEACLKKNKMQSLVKKLEDETVMFTKNYQELYDNEIMIENDLWKTWIDDK